MHGTNRWRILLVEDDEDDFILIRDMLQSNTVNPIDLEWIARFDQFLEIVCLEDYDLFLVDYRLDIHDGLELIQKLHEVCPDAKAILLTGWPHREINVVAFRAGAINVLNKSELSTEILIDAIEKTIVHPPKTK